MRSWAVVLLLAVIVGAVWLTTRTDEQPPAAPATASDLPDAQTAPAPIAVDADSRAAEPTAEAAPVRIEAAPAPVDRDDGERLAVTIVRKDTGAPLPGAEVLFAAADNDPQTMSAEERELRERSGNDLETVLRRFGKSLHADSDGVVRIPQPKNWTTIAGLHEQDGHQLYGQLTINLQQPDPEGGWRLQLEPDYAVRVEVTDAAAGKPVADVAIALLVPLPVAFTGGRARQMPVTVGETGADGSLLVSHVQARRSFGMGEPGELRQITVTVHEPGIDLQREVSFVEPGDDVVRFVLPAVGRLLVEVGDARGEPLQETAYVAVSEKTDKPGVFFFGSDQWQRRTRAGRVEFKHVALGRTWTLRAYVDQQSISETTAGPTVAGQEVRTRLHLDPEATILVGRALDEDGAPLANTTLQLHLEDNQGNDQTSHSETDADGRFRFGIPPRAMHREIEVARLLQNAGSSARLARLHLSGTLPAGHRDLGDVRLGVLPLLADGKLTGDDERRLSGVTVRVETCAMTAGNREFWRPASALHVARDGARFAVHGLATGDRLRLSVWSRQYPSVSPLEFTAGQRGLVIALVPGGSAKAVVLHDENIAGAQLVARLRPRGEATAHDSPPTLVAPLAMFGGGFGRDGRGQPVTSENGRTTFQWSGLRAGLYDFTIHVVGNERALFEARGVALVAGETNDDERLREIDLRGRLRSVTLRIVGADGAALGNKFGTVLFRSEDGSASRSQSVNIFGGEATLLLSEPSVDLLVSVQGYRPQQLDNVFRDTTVQLSLGPLVRLRLRSGTTALPADAILRAYLTLDAPAEQPPRDPVLAMFTGNASHWIELKNGEGTVHTARSGSFKVSAQASLGNKTIAHYVAEPAQIEVRDTDVEQVFEIELRPRPEGKK